VIKPGRESLEEELDKLGTLAVARLTSLAVHEARALLAELTLGGNLRSSEDSSANPTSTGMRPLLTVYM